MPQMPKKQSRYGISPRMQRAQSFGQIQADAAAQTAPLRTIADTMSVFSQELEARKKEKKRLEAKMLLARENTEIANAEVANLQAYQVNKAAFEETVYDPEKPNEAAEAFQKATKDSNDAINKTFSNEVTAEKYKQKVGLKNQGWLGDMAKADRAKRINFYESSYFNNIEAAVEVGSDTMVEELTNNAIAAGILDPVKAEVSRASALKRVKIVQRQNDISILWSQVVDLPDRRAVIDRLKLDTTLPREDKDGIVAAYDRESRIKRDRAKQMQDATAAEFFTRVDDLEIPLDMQDINTAVYAGDLSLTEAKYFKRIMEIDDSKIANNPDVYISLNDDINQGLIDESTLRSEVLKARSSKDLNRQASNFLLNKISQKRTKTDKNWRVKASKYLRSQIVPSRGMTAIAVPQEDKLLAEAEIALDDMIIEAKESGKPIKGKDILQSAMDISDAYRLSLAEKTAYLTGNLLGDTPDIPVKKKTERKVVRTATYKGREILIYSNGDTEYAK